MNPALLTRQEVIDCIKTLTEQRTDQTEDPGTIVNGQSSPMYQEARQTPYSRVEGKSTASKATRPRRKVRPTQLENPLLYSKRRHYNQ